VSIGTAPGRIVPPIGVTPEPQRTPRGPQPQVIEYLESMHKIQPGDTFEKISLDQYGSKEYATALLLYNRGHPIVGESFASDNASLTPGQRIFLPSNKELLESRYPAAIKSVATHTQSNAPPVEPGLPKSYTVAAGGETFARVASKLFENVDRWTEIRNLNRELDPEKPIPAGTILKVPGDARIP
jgi:nucleoid-associated protein YgaU